jgi:DNA modification methylase
VHRSAVGALGVPQAQIICDDAASALAKLPPDSVDCIVTSPPYFGVTDYAKAQRLSMEWFSEEIERVRLREIGARSKRHRISALKDYLIELDVVFRQIYRVAKTGAITVIVFGQSPSRPESQSAFVQNLRDLGFSFCLERQRHIAIGRRQMPSVVRETILVVQK